MHNRQSDRGKSYAAGPLALYVHFPWCVKKCPYCDFNSHPLNQELPEEAYLQALLSDWSFQRQSIEKRKISSVFFGGGTPSLFQPKSFERLIEAFAPFLDADTEITMEANPGTLEYGNLADYRAAGINRLSMGVQSFADEALTALGRIHNGREAETAIKSAQDAGFANINIDLMHGLPKQSVEAALSDLRRAIALNVAHISWYQLTIEPRTEFAQRPPLLPDEETLFDIETKGLAVLRDAGFTRYEISAYAKEDRQSQHNSNYWKFGDYLGLGAGAHGKLSINSFVGTGTAGRLNVSRRAHPRQPRLYQLQATEDNWQLSENKVNPDELPSEFMMNALRLVTGVEEGEFERATGLPLSHIEDKLRKWRRMGVMDSQRIQLTPMGLNSLDTVVADFLPD